MAFRMKTTLKLTTPSLHLVAKRQRWNRGFAVAPTRFHAAQAFQRTTTSPSAGCIEGSRFGQLVDPVSSPPPHHLPHIPHPHFARGVAGDGGAAACGGEEGGGGGEGD